MYTYNITNGWYEDYDSITLHHKEKYNQEELKDFLYSTIEIAGEQERFRITLQDLADIMIDKYEFISPTIHESVRISKDDIEFIRSREDLDRE